MRLCLHQKYHAFEERMAIFGRCDDNLEVFTTKVLKLPKIVIIMPKLFYG